jgi:hypothetical protein
MAQDRLAGKQLDMRSKVLPCRDAVKRPSVELSAPYIGAFGKGQCKPRCIDWDELSQRGANGRVERRRISNHIRHSQRNIWKGLPRLPAGAEGESGRQNGVGTGDGIGKCRSPQLDGEKWGWPTSRIAVQREKQDGHGLSRHSAWPVARREGANGPWWQCKST